MMMLICRMMTAMMTAMMILIQIEKVPAHCSQEPSELSGLRQVSVRWQMRPPIHRHHHHHDIIMANQHIPTSQNPTMVGF